MFPGKLRVLISFVEVLKKIESRIFWQFGCFLWCQTSDMFFNYSKAVHILLGSHHTRQKFCFFCLKQTCLFFKPLPPVGVGGGYVFGSSVRAAVRPSVRDSRGSVVLFPRYLQYLLTDFRRSPNFCHWCILGHR